MKDEPGRVGRLLRSIRKEIPEALADGYGSDDAEVAPMLRELGIALARSVVDLPMLDAVDHA